MYVLVAGDSRCIDAFMVALNETCGGKKWYISTVQLQLASVEFCVACRSVSTLHLFVDEGTPRHLWADNCSDQSGARGSSIGGSSEGRSVLVRVPPFRPREVTWNLPPSMLSHASKNAFTNLECLSFSDAVAIGLTESRYLVV